MPLDQKQIHNLLQDLEDGSSPRNRARLVLQAGFSRLLDAHRGGTHYLEIRHMEFQVVDAIVASYMAGDLERIATGTQTPHCACRPFPDGEDFHLDGTTRFTGEGKR